MYNFTFQTFLYVMTHGVMTVRTLHYLSLAPFPEVFLLPPLNEFTLPTGHFLFSSAR